MFLKYAETFRDVASLRSFSQAAKVRGMSQPAVSHAIHQLEEYLGVSLFDRSTRPLELTVAGQTYYEGCQSLLDRFEQLEDEVRGLGAKIAGRVRVAAIYSVGLLEMSVVLADFEQQCPDVEVLIQYVHPNEVYSLVGSGEADFGIVSHPRTGSDWESTLWRTQKMVVVTHPDHHWADRDDVAFNDLDQQCFIGLTPELATRVDIDRKLKQAGVRVQIDHEFDNIDTICRVVADGVGISILPEATIRREIDAGTVCSLDVRDVELARPLGILKRRNGSLSNAAQAFVDILLDSPPQDEPGNGAIAEAVVPDDDGATRTV